MTISTIQATIQNARPRSFSLPSGRVAFVIIDMQRDFVQEGGYGSYQCPTKEIFENVSTSIKPIKLALKASREAGVTVIHTREGHEPTLSDCAPTKLLRQKGSNPDRHALCIGDEGPMGRLLVRGEYGHDIIDELKPLRNEIVLDKPAKGSFCNTNFYEILTAFGITHIIMAGVTTECCVATTFREANDRGFECCVLSDCTGGFNQDIVKWSLEGFCAYDGLFGYLSNSTDYISSLQLYHNPTSDFIGDLSYLSITTSYKSSSNTIYEVVKKFYNYALEESSGLQLTLNPWSGIVKRLTELQKYGGDLPPLYGTPFVTTGEIPTSSRIMNEVLNLGAIHIGVLPTSNFITGFDNSLDQVFEHNVCSFVLSVDTDGSSHAMAGCYNNNRIYSFTPSAKGVFNSNWGTSSNRISVMSRELSLSRLLWGHLVKLDTASNCHNYPVDFRDIPERQLRIGVLPGGMVDSLPSTVQQRYREIIQRVSENTGCELISVEWEKNFEFANISELIQNQEKIATLHSNEEWNLRQKDIEYLESFETPGWKIAAKAIEFASMRKAITTQFGHGGVQLLMIPTLPVEIGHNWLSDRSLENLQSLKSNVKCLNSLEMPSLTVSNLRMGNIPVTFAAAPGLDWQILDFVQYLVNL